MESSPVPGTPRGVLRTSLEDNRLEAKLCSCASLRAPPLPRTAGERGLPPESGLSPPYQDDGVRVVVGGGYRRLLLAPSPIPLPNHGRARHTQTVCACP